jgi:hypothetical protein
VRIGHAAGHQPSVGAAGAALLKYPTQRLVRLDLLPARVQRGANAGQVVVRRRGKAGQNEHRWKHVQRPGPAVREAIAAPVKDALCIPVQRHGRDGVKQGLCHGQAH